MSWAFSVVYWNSGRVTSRTNGDCDSVTALCRQCLLLSINLAFVMTTGGASPQARQLARYCAARGETLVVLDDSELKPVVSERRDMDQYLREKVLEAWIRKTQGLLSGHWLRLHTICGCSASRMPRQGTMRGSRHPVGEGQTRPRGCCVRPQRRVLWLPPWLFWGLP